MRLHGDLTRWKTSVFVIPLSRLSNRSLRLSPSHIMSISQAVQAWDAWRRRLLASLSVHSNRHSGMCSLHISQLGLSTL
ncbi:hypothetical protein PoB_001642200 [Plakobranchus ocellatus]|uniref:Uncharacterized protein n=1 Tax=Plakobranchus ocellatus TaxID=259542 RepID=A0AAV3Z5U9_9GAST|nr:hypothetical protein PoB_001642200 [Plakobranchus ocellatus]